MCRGRFGPYRMARKFGGVAKAKVRALLAGSTAISVPAQNFARLAFHKLSRNGHQKPRATAQAKTHDFAKQIGSFLYHGVLRKMIRVSTFLSLTVTSYSSSSATWFEDAFN